MMLLRLVCLLIMMVIRLIDWLIGWLVGWLVGWSILMFLRAVCEDRVWAIIRIGLFPEQWLQRHPEAGSSHTVLTRCVRSAEREFFIDNLLVRNHFIIVMIRWTGLALWELNPLFQIALHLPSYVERRCSSRSSPAPRRSSSKSTPPNVVARS